MLLFNYAILAMKINIWEHYVPVTWSALRLTIYHATIKQQSAHFHHTRTNKRPNINMTGNETPSFNFIYTNTRVGADVIWFVCCNADSMEKQITCQHEMTNYSQFIWPKKCTQLFTYITYIAPTCFGVPNTIFREHVMPSCWLCLLAEHQLL
jgi:hypothetical protein